MLSAQSAIHRYRRDVTLGRIVRSLLLVAGMASVLVLPFWIKGFESTIGLSVVFGLWIFLSFTSAKNSRIFAPSSELIATGQFEEAEKRIDEGLKAFSLSRTPKLLGLHHLAVLRHKQKQWQDSAVLGRAVLSQQSSGGVPGLEYSSRLLLADSLLELGDVRAAGEVISPLRGQPLGLNEQMAMLQVELDVQSRQGAWELMLAGLAGKVQLAELMPAHAAARVQAALALAAQKRGLTDWSDWLRRRAELLTDINRLTTDRAVLWELWQAKSGE